MKHANFEPFLILFLTGIFLVPIAGRFLHVFPVRNVTVVHASIPAKKTPVKVSQEVAASDSLKALTEDGDTISNTFTGMEFFYQSVRQVQSDHALLHIAYFGDSMIEGDLVTQSLRRFLQQKFGGNGIGFIPVTTPLPGFRTTIRQRFNNNWDVFSFVHKGTSGVHPGLSGYVYVSSQGAESTYESPPGYALFHKAQILYGGNNSITMKVVTDTTTTVLSFPPSKSVSSFTVKPDTAFSLFGIKITSSEPGIFYGVNFENTPGIYVDNYAFRGNSGLPLTTIPTELFSELNSTLKNKLLIIHYGLNVFTPGVEDYHWYEIAMENVIRHVKESSPGISILMISMPDRSALILGEYHTPSGLPGFIRLQKRVAAREHVAFFNLYEAMGGANSMKKWVEGHPKLASDDYTHPNGAGAVRIASLVYDYLIKGYDQFTQHPDSLAVAKLSGNSL